MHENDVFRHETFISFSCIEMSNSCMEIFPIKILPVTSRLHARFSKHRTVVHTEVKIYKTKILREKQHTKKGIHEICVRKTEELMTTVFTSVTRTFWFKSLCRYGVNRPFSIKRVGTAGQVQTKPSWQLPAHYSACILQQSSPSISIKSYISPIIFNKTNYKFNIKYVIYLRTKSPTLSNLSGEDTFYFARFC